MPKYAKHIALLAAFAMLCGCTGNTGSTQTSTAEAVQTAQGSAEARIAPRHRPPEKPPQMYPPSRVSRNRLNSQCRQGTPRAFR